MSRDLTLLHERNKQIRADYNRLRSTEQPLTVQGKKTYIRLSYAQTLDVLANKYFISARRIEAVLGQTESKLAPLKPKTE